MIVVLHNIRSAHNVGSIFRTADAAGFEQIYLCGYTPVPEDKYGMPNRKVLKVSLGAEEHVEWFVAASCTRLLDKLKKEGKYVVCVEQDPRSVDLDCLKLTKRQRENLVLVMGNEVRGLHPNILKCADKIVEIPMHGEKASLNVSVAFGVVAYGLK